MTSSELFLMLKKQTLENHWFERNSNDKKRTFFRTELLPSVSLTDLKTLYKVSYRPVTMRLVFPD